MAEQKKCLIFNDMEIQQSSVDRFYVKSGKVFQLLSQ